MTARKIPDSYRPPDRICKKCLVRCHYCATLWKYAGGRHRFHMTAQSGRRSYHAACDDHRPLPDDL